MTGAYSMNAGILAIIMVFSIPLVAVIGGLALAALRISKGSASSAQLAEETRLIQDLHHGLQKMEERIEALEVIMLEKKSSKTDAL
jgi:phage shock protein B